MPQGLDFEDSPEILFQKIKDQPIQQSDSALTGHAVWRFDDYTLHAYAQSHPIPGALLLDKTLTISGERLFRKKAWPFRLFWWAVKWASLTIFRRNPWKLTSPPKLITLPLRYESVSVQPSHPNRSRIYGNVAFSGSNSSIRLLGQTGNFSSVSFSQA